MTTEHNDRLAQAFATFGKAEAQRKSVTNAKIAEAVQSVATMRNKPATSNRQKSNKRKTSPIGKQAARTTLIRAKFHNE